MIQKKLIAREVLVLFAFVIIYAVIIISLLIIKKNLIEKHQKIENTLTEKFIKGDKNPPVTNFVALHNILSKDINYSNYIDNSSERFALKCNDTSYQLALYKKLKSDTNTYIGVGSTFSSFQKFFSLDNKGLINLLSLYSDKRQIEGSYLYKTENSSLLLIVLAFMFTIFYLIRFSFYAFRWAVLALKE